MDIDAKHLMIGNFLKNKEGIIVKIDARSIFDIWNQSKDYTCVPITEEFLIKRLGFNKEYKKGWIGIDVKNDNGITTDFILSEPYSMGEWQSFYAFVYDSYRFVKIEFLHELQNLYIAITKKQLIEKLN